MMILSPYLSFTDNTREAMEFYRSVFGGELTVTTFAEFPGLVQDDADDALVMHAQLTTDAGLTLMAADTPRGVPYREPAGVALSVSGDDTAALEGYWNGLAAGGTVTMPLDTPPWGGRFGMLVDRYGFSWMVSIDASS